MELEESSLNKETEHWVELEKQSRSQDFNITK